MKIKYYTHGEELTGFDIALKKGTTIIDTLKIPSVVEGKPISHIATTIGEAFSKLKGKGISEIKNVLIEEGISSISNHAFSNIDIKIDNVCWSASCTVIPAYCFFASHIESITGIDFVATIGKGAFALSDVQTFSWPLLCKSIPAECFEGSPLIEITGTDKVTNIEREAFCGTKLQRFSWPQKCQNIPNDCFRECDCLEQIDGLEVIINIGDGAFQRTKIKTFCCPASISATEICLFLSDCEYLEEIKFTGTIKDIDLECFSWAKNIKRIDLTQLGAVNLINCSTLKGREVRDKVIPPPYYVTEIN